MSENDNQDPPLPSPPPDTPPPDTPGFPPLPPVYAIPAQIIEGWLKITPTTYIEARISRQDLDSLLFGLTKSVEAQQLTHECIIRWSNGDLAGANQLMDNSKRRAIEAENHIRQFFTAIMAAAVIKP